MDIVIDLLIAVINCMKTIWVVYVTHKRWYTNCKHKYRPMYFCDIEMVAAVEKTARGPFLFPVTGSSAFNTLLIYALPRRSGYARWFPLQARPRMFRFPEIGNWSFRPFYTIAPLLIQSPTVKPHRLMNFVISSI